MATETARRRPLATALIAIALVSFGAPWTGLVSAQSQSLFISFSDADGNPVTDITRDEVLAEVDGERSETLDFERVDWPIRVTVFVDNGLASPPALQHMREGLRLFVEALDADIEVAIATIGGRPQFWARHTTDPVELENAIGVLIPDPSGEATFLDALYEEAERLHEDEEGQYFPVILMVVTNGPEGSTRVRPRPFQRMWDRLIANNAVVHTRMVTVPSVTGVKQGGDQIRWAIDIGEATGGSYQGLSAPNGFRTLLPQLAEDLTRKHRLVSSQYRLTFALPEDATGQSALRILTTRPDVTMISTHDGNVP